MFVVEESTYLEHFGIKGMQWGIRKRVEKADPSNTKKEPGLRALFAARQDRINAGREAVLKSKAAKSGLRIAELNKQIETMPSGVLNSYKKNELKNQLKLAQRDQKRSLKKAEKTKDDWLTPTQKKVVIGAVAVGAILVAVHFNRTGGEDVTSAIRRIQSMHEHGSIFKVDKSLADKNLSAEEVLSKVAKTVNPNYHEAGGKMNCRRATFAYELRRRGYHVDATPSEIGRGQSETGLVNALIRGDRNKYRSFGLSTMIVGGKDIRTGAALRDKRTYGAFAKTIGGLSKLKYDVPELRDALGKMPNGARGEVVFNERGFGHSMAWEIIKGKPHIFDTQKGQHFPVTAEGITKLTQKWGVPKEVALTRLDDVDLDMNFLSRWARNSS